jgi:putative membrane protein
MKHGLPILLVFGLFLAGCSSNNKAATPDNNSAQPASSSAAANANSGNSSSTSSGPNAANTNPDQDFVNNAAKGNRAEVQLGKMVAAKTKDPSVKQFAQMMVKDHTDALNKLQQVAQSKNITVPDGIPDDAQALQSKLSSDTGKQLDKDYMDGMVQDHQKDVQEFQQAINTLQDPDIKNWATTTLPTLQKHLDRAQQVDSKVNGGKSGGSNSGE